MNLLPVLAGSLAGILLVAGLVVLLGLGRDGRIDDPEQLAEELLPGFLARQAFADSRHRSALVEGEDGTWALLGLHGRHPVARRFPTRPAMARTDAGVRFDPGERFLAPVTIDNDRLLTLL